MDSSMDFLDFLDDIAILEDMEFLYQDSGRRRDLRNRVDPFAEYNEIEFKKRFRLQKDTVRNLLTLIEDKIKHATDRNQCATPMLQLLVTLRFYATGSFYNTVGDFSGLHKSTVCHIVKRVTEAIASLGKQCVNPPSTKESIRQTQLDFYKLSQFPRVVGAIDCTHIRITSPGGISPEDFRNCKGFFSLKVQAMCNANLRFDNIVARWPGSTHSCYIFENSRAKFLLDNGTCGNGIVLANREYYNNAYLVTPFDNPVTAAERLFNDSHVTARNVIETCFGLWKRRFPVLSGVMRCRITLVQDIVVATVVLHNFAIDQNDAEPPVDPEVNTEPEPIFEAEDPEVDDDGIENQARAALLMYFQSVIDLE